MNLPNPIKYTVEEGGSWIDWQSHRHYLAHAIMFEDGSVFDMVNGWRKNMNYCIHCGARKK